MRSTVSRRNASAIAIVWRKRTGGLPPNARAKAAFRFRRRTCRKAPTAARSRRCSFSPADGQSFSAEAPNARPVATQSRLIYFAGGCTSYQGRRAPGTSVRTCSSRRPPEKSGYSYAATPRSGSRRNGVVEADRHQTLAVPRRECPGAASWDWARLPGRRSSTRGRPCPTGPSTGCARCTAARWLRTSDLDDMLALVAEMAIPSMMARFRNTATITAALPTTSPW